MDGKLMQAINEVKLVPVVKLDSAKDAVPLAEALIKGGLPVAEITFRTEAAEESIRNIRKECPDMLVGAGTIINVEQAKKALAAGAEFLVSPGTGEEVLKYAVSQGIPIFPGICTPTEIMLALSYGLDIVKFFPASQYGGIKAMKALAGPFPQIRFMPTGGVNEENLKDYLSFPKVVACGGSWMVKDTLIKAGQFDEIERLAKEAVKLAKEAVS